MADDSIYVRPDVANLLATMAGSGAPELQTLPLAEARGAFAMMGQMFEADPTSLAVIRDISCPGPAGSIPCRLYDARETRKAGPLITFFHGGGWVIGDLESHHSLCTHIAEAMDLPVLAVDYRLAPEAAFPAAADDCIAAARWAAGSPAELGRTVSGLVTMGDSAGGNLAIVVADALAESPAAVPVLVQVPIYPVTDLGRESQSYHQFADGYLLTRSGMEWFDDCYKADLSDPRINVFKGNIAAAPPTVLVTAGLDPLRDQGRAYGQALLGAGRDVCHLEARGMVHGFVNLRKAVPSVAGDIDAIFSTIRLMLGR